MAKDIGLEEWLTELDRLHRGSAGGKGQSVSDICRATGMSEIRVRKLVKAAKDAGEIVVDTEFRPSIADRLQKIPVYRRASAKDKKK